MWSLKKDETFAQQPSDGGRPAVECGGREPGALGCGNGGQRPGSSEVALEAKSWLPSGLTQEGQLDNECRRRLRC